MTRNEVSLQTLLNLPRVANALPVLIRAEHALIPTPPDSPVLLDLGLVEESGRLTSKGHQTLTLLRRLSDLWDVPAL